MYIKKWKEDSQSLFFIKSLNDKKRISEGYISGEMLRDRDNPQNYIVITTWQSVADWERYEKVPKTSKVHTRIEKLMARPTNVKTCMHV